MCSRMRWLLSDQTTALSAAHLREGASQVVVVEAAGGGGESGKMNRRRREARGAAACRKRDRPAAASHWQLMPSLLARATLQTILSLSLFGYQVCVSATKLAIQTRLQHSGDSLDVLQLGPGVHVAPLLGQAAIEPAEQVWNSVMLWSTEGGSGRHASRSLGRVPQNCGGKCPARRQLAHQQLQLG